MTEEQALQFHYTSCRRGLAGNPGWQTRALSDGVEHEERRELERMAQYEPPRDVPVHTAAEPVCDVVPKAFKVSQLSSGRTAIARIAYVGKDYSNRWGNFFAHALLFRGPLEGRWPIDAYPWSGWVSRLDEGEDEREPQPLPTVPLPAVTDTTEFSFDELRTFLLEVDGRVELLETVLMAVFRRSEDARKIVVRERHELDAVYWIACIQKAFPPSCQTSLSCSTFQFDPRTALAINATIGETDFLFDDAERRHQFYVFDLVTGVHSEVPEAQREYARTIATWMAAAPQQLQGFHEFVARFGQADIGPDLLDLLMLYRLECGEQFALRDSGFRSMLAFLRTRAHRPQLGSIVGLLAALLRDGGVAITPETRIEALRVLVDGAAAAEQTANWRLVFETWVDAFDHLVVVRDDAALAIEPLRAQLEAKLGDTRSRELAETFLEVEHLERMQSYMGRLSDGGRATLMRELERACRRTSRQPTYQTSAVRALIDAGLRHGGACVYDLQWVLAPYSEDPNGVQAILAYVLARGAQLEQDGVFAPEASRVLDRNLGRSLSAILETRSEADRFAMINRIKEVEEFNDVLLSEWEASIAAASDRGMRHVQYAQHVLSDESRFAYAMQGTMLMRVLDELPRDAAASLAAEWVGSGRSRRLSSEVATTVLAHASQCVTLMPEDRKSEILAQHLREELAERQLRLQPDRLALRQVACQVVSSADGAVGVPAVLAQVDAGTYSEFVGVVLPRLLTKVTKSREYGQALESFAREPHRRPFADAYLEYLNQRPADRFSQSDLIALEYWLSLDDSRSAWPALGGVRRTVLQTMARRYGDMGRSDRVEAAASLADAPAFANPVLKRRLKAFLELVDELKPSWFDRLRRRFESSVKPRGR